MSARLSPLRRAAFFALPLLLLSGCLFTTRKLPLPRAPSVTQTATGEELVDQINKRWDALQSLNVTRGDPGQRYQTRRKASPATTPPFADIS